MLCVSIKPFRASEVAGCIVMQLIFFITQTSLREMHHELLAAVWRPKMILTISGAVECLNRRRTVINSWNIEPATHLASVWLPCCSNDQLPMIVPAISFFKQSTYSDLVTCLIILHFLGGKLLFSYVESQGLFQINFLISLDLLMWFLATTEKWVMAVS